MALCLTLISCQRGFAADSFAQQLVTRVISETVAEHPNLVRVCLEGTVEIVDDNEVELAITSEETLDLIAQVINGAPTGIGRNRLERVELCNDAQLKLSRIKVMHRESGKMARVELHRRHGEVWQPFKTISVALSEQSTEVPQVESSAPQPPPKVRVPLTSQKFTARYLPSQGVEGGFGIRIVVEGEPVSMQRSESLNLFLAKGLADGTDFEIELVNHYPFEAAAEVRLDGNARMFDTDGSPVLDYVPPSQDGQPGIRRLSGWGITGDLRSGESFRLRHDDLDGNQKHHVEVEFRFASKDRARLLAVESQVPAERGYSIQRGKRIASPIELKPFFIGSVRERVMLAFID